MDVSPDSDLLMERYSKLLGVPPARPSLDYLTDLTAAQLQRVPFENLSKLYYRKRHRLEGLPGLARHLDGIEHYRFGGTCYPNNTYFHRLLRHLGFDDRLCGEDMETADAHFVIGVAVEGREFLVDGGYAAPLLVPLPRDLDTDYVIALGRDRYVLEPQDAHGRSRLVLYRDGHRTHGYLAKPEPRRIEEFAEVIAASFRPQAVFMNALLLVRFFPGRSITIHNLKLIVAEGSRWTERILSGVGELATVVQENFGIPREVVYEVVADLDLSGDPWG